MLTPQPPASYTGFPFGAEEIIDEGLKEIKQGERFSLVFKI
jgi:hypothetical protein